MAKSVSKRAKLTRDLRRVRRDALKNNASRRNATKALAQCAMAVPRRNFGSKISKGSLRQHVLALDARLPRTLGLPRAVGPYTIIRTTTLHKSSAEFVLFAPFESKIAGGGRWYNWCGVEGVDANLGIAAAGNTRAITIPIGELAAAAEVVPASMTVQVMNPAPLQSADGIYAMGRVSQQLNYGGVGGVTWADLRTRFISYFSPRLLTGGKLALRGVKCSAFPLDMSEYSAFQPVEDFAGEFTWAANAQTSAALSPIVFVQNNVVPNNIEFLITIEWRVRFDPGNPAVASHVHHDTTADSVWNDVCRDMAAAGHGVVELAEDTMEGGALMTGARVATAALL